MQFPKSGTCLYSLSPLLLLVFAISIIVLNYRITTRLLLFLLFSEEKKGKRIFCSFFLLSVVFGPTVLIKRSSFLTNKTHRKHAEETSSEREKQTLRGQRTRTLFYTERTFVHLESIASVVFIGREWMFSARERFRKSFLPLTFKPKMSGFWKSAEICKDAKTTRRFVSIYFHRN